MTEQIDSSDQIIFRQAFLASGGTHRQIQGNLRSGVWTSLMRGAYVPASVWQGLSAQGRYRAQVQARLLKSDDGAACLESAAVLHGLNLLNPLPGVVHTVNYSPDHGGRVTRDRHRHVWQERPELTTVRGLPATSLTQTLIDMAKWRDMRRAIVPIEHALNSQEISVRDLLEHPLVQVRSPGAKRARHLFGFASEHSESPGESLSRALFYEKGLELPLSQYQVVGADGRNYRSDFGWPHLRLLGEFDGRAKYGDDPAQVSKSLWEEKQREDALRAAGYRVVRWVWKDIFNSDYLIRRLVELGLGQNPSHARRRHWVDTSSQLDD